MLLTLKDDNTTGSLYVFHVLYVLNIIMISHNIYGQDSIYIQLLYVQMA